MTDLDPDPRPNRPVEFRTVTDMSVRFAERMIDIVLMPYDTEAGVVVRGRPCVESHAPGAFDGVERRANRVKVNRDHDLHRTVGRAVALHPSRAEGLVGELRIARTPLGDDTLGLAEDQSLEASVGFQVMPGGEHWTEHRSRRRVTKAYLDHIALVPEGAYDGRVLDVRNVVMLGNAAQDTPSSVPTPNLDEVLAWMASRGDA